MIPLLKNKDELKEFLEYCELAVEKTGNTLNGRGPLQLCHFTHKLTHSALRFQIEPVVILLSKAAWSEVCGWKRWGAKGPKDYIGGMKCYHLNYPEIFDTFNGNELTSTTLWSFSGPPTLGNDPNQGLDLPNKPASFSSWNEQWETLNVDISSITGITKLTLRYEYD